MNNLTKTRERDPKNNLNIQTMTEEWNWKMQNMYAQTMMKERIWKDGALYPQRNMSDEGMPCNEYKFSKREFKIKSNEGQMLLKI